MIRKKYFSFLFLLLPIFVLAQDRVSFKPTVSAHFNPLAFIDFLDGNFSIGAEYKFHPHWSVGLDAGYVFYSAYVRNKGVTGYILRPFARVYPNQKRNSFFQVEFHLKQVYYKQENWAMQFQNGMPVFEELKKYNWKKTAYGFHVSYGGQLFLSRDEKFRAELFCGLGLRWINQGPPQSTDPPARTVFNLEVYEGKNFVPVLPMGFRLVYKIK